MLRYLIALLAVGTLLVAANSAIPSDDPPIGSAAISTGNALVVSGTETRSTPDNARSPGSRTDTPDRADDPVECDPARAAGCDFAGVRVTDDDGTPLTITDVAQFAPAAAPVTGEPGNVGIAGLPTNFIAPVTAQTTAGVLLDRPLTVRFTPVRFDFTYGDGTTTTSASGGRSWPALGQASFTPTPTSHTYRVRGTYAARVTVHYTAEVDIGGGWFPVTGELAIAGTTRQIRVYEADTALVARTCTEQPTAPGC